MAETASTDEVVWAVLAFVGIALHARNLWRLRGPLPAAANHPDERMAVLMFRVSDGLRIVVKGVLLLGALYALGQAPPVMDTPGEVYQFWGWRAGLIVVTAALNCEALWQGWMRSRLSRRWESAGAS